MPSPNNSKSTKSNVAQKIMLQKRKRVWAKLYHGPGVNMSLPESFIAEPHEFLSYFHEHMDRDDDGLAEDGYSIIDNIGYILLPRRTRETARVIQGFDPPRPYFFEIIQLDQIEHEMPRLADTWSCSRYVDLLTPYLQGVNAFELKQAVNCLVDEIEGRKGASWDRRACERFFDDRRNFVPLQFRMPNKLDWRSN